jgi:hypothetical protein
MNLVIHHFATGPNSQSSATDMQIVPNSKSQNILDPDRQEAVSVYWKRIILLTEVFRLIWRKYIGLNNHHVTNANSSLRFPCNKTNQMH